MSTFRIIREIFTILFGVGAVIAGIVLEAEDPWLYILGVVLIAWGAWDIYKELRDSAESGEVSEMSKEREEMKKRLGGKE